MWVTEDTTVLTGGSPDTPGNPGGLDPLIGRVLEGRYELHRRIASGGMATVYLGTDRRLDRDVAVKIMHPALAHDPEFVARFEREAKAAARVNHATVVGVNDAGQDGAFGDQVLFLVMEYVPGQTLGDLIRRQGRLSAAQSLTILEPVLAALDAASAAGLVHRDIKPDNVLLADTGEVKVADFGIARAMAASSLTANFGQHLGTVAYAAPEQFNGDQIDGRTDIYAAGVLLYEMLTGEVPFTGATPMEVAFQHVHGQVPAPSERTGGLPPSVDELVRRATAPNPADRFPDAAMFRIEAARAHRQLPPPSRRGDTAALPAAEQITGALPAGARPAGSPAPIRRPPPLPRPVGAPRRHRRLRLVVLILLVAASVLAGVAGWWFGSGRFVHVPKLAGMSPAAAGVALRHHHLAPASGARAYSDTVGAGLVVRTDPGNGARLSRGDAVHLVISRGVEMVKVPALTGKPVADAKAALAASSLGASSVKQVYSDTAPTGRVVSEAPAAGATVRHDSDVTLTVSQGPAPVALPDLRGTGSDEAKRTLSGLGLHARTTTAFSDSVDRGTVISQDPGAGTAHRGDTVTVVVSKGPKLIAVPKLRGLSAADARAKLRADGLQSSEHDLFGIAGKVVAQSPSAGTLVKSGTKVTFYTAAY